MEAREIERIYRRKRIPRKDGDRKCDQLVEIAYGSTSSHLRLDCEGVSLAKNKRHEELS